LDEALHECEGDVSNFGPVGIDRERVATAFDLDDFRWALDATVTHRCPKIAPPFRP